MKIIDGKIVIDVCDLFDKLDENTLQEIINSLACQTSIIENVAAQLVGETTELGYYSGVATPTDILDSAISKAREFIISKADSCAQDIIRSLRSELECIKKHANTGRKEYHELRRRYER